MSRHAMNLIRLAFAAALLYILGFAGHRADLQPFAVLILFLAVGFEAAFWVTLIRGGSRGKVHVDRDG